jgi:hypothetical protein
MPADIDQSVLVKMIEDSWTLDCATRTSQRCVLLLDEQMMLLLREQTPRAIIYE